MLYAIWKTSITGGIRKTRLGDTFTIGDLKSLIRNIPNHADIVEATDDETALAIYDNLQES